MILRKVRQKIKQKLKPIIKNLFRLDVGAGKVSTTELVNRIFNFCEVFAGRVFYTYQAQFAKRIIRSVLENDGDEITALFARQSGKTETVASTVAGLMVILPILANMPMFLNDKRLQMFQDGMWVGIFAPSQRQAQITYNRMRGRMATKHAQVVLEEFGLFFTTSNGQTVTLSNGSFATAISASDGSNIEGESFKFIILEECQDISNYKIRKSVHPMGAAYNSTICKIGTATTFKGDFYDAIERNKKSFEEGTIRVRNHFEYDCDVVKRYNPRYEKYLEKEKKRLGEKSDEFLMSYKLKWIISRGMFVDAQKMEKENGDEYLGRVYSDKKATHVVGIDIGGGSSKNKRESDSTVVTVVEVDWNNPVVMETSYDEELGENITYTAYNSYIKDWLEISPEIAEDYEEQYHMIMDYLSNFKVAKLVIDVTRESSLAHRIRANVGYEVVPFTFGQKSKSELYKHLGNEITTGRARFPKDEDTMNTPEYKKFIKQFSDLQKSYSGAYLVVSHPNERGAHDDFCLSSDTKILTKRGFLGYNELTSDDEVAEVKNKELLFRKPDKIIRKKYSGNMYRFASKDLDISVTENHKMLTFDSAGEQFVLPSQDLYEKSLRNYKILNAPKQNLPEYPISDTKLRLLSFIIALGKEAKGARGIPQVVVTIQRKSPVFPEFCFLLGRQKLDVTEVYDEDRNVQKFIFKKENYDFIVKDLTDGINVVPRLWMNSFSERQLQTIIYTFSAVFSGKDKTQIEVRDYHKATDFQELCMRCGIKTSIRRNLFHSKVSYVCYMMSSPYSEIKDFEKTEVENVDVWCVNVGNGFIVTSRNNKIAVVGNCDSWALAVYGARDEGYVDQTETVNRDKAMSIHKAIESYSRNRNRRTARRR